MFSFFKKLFSFQKTDTNSVREDQQQEKLETNSGHSTFVDSSVKDNSLNKSSRINERHQQVESRKLSDFYSKESASFSSDKNFIKSYKNIETREKVDLRKFSKFYSKESISAASGSNAHTSFDNQVNTISKSQRQCKKLATKKITEVIEELTKNSDDIDDIVDQCKEQKSGEKPKLIKKSDRLHQKTIRFCFQCKTSLAIVGNTTTRKNCNKCGSMLYYLCTICKDKYYASYWGWKAHESKCNCKNPSQLVESIGSKTTSNRRLKTTLNILNEKIVRFPLIKTRGMAAQIKKPVLENTEGGGNIEGGMGKALIKKIIAVKPMKTNRFKKWIRRYCPKCQKAVAGKTPFMKKKIKCQTCTTLLQFQCVKCHTQKDSNSGMYHHLHQQCFPNDRTAIQPKNRSTRRRLMPSIQLIQNKYLKCDLCTYQSTFKANLKRHVHTVHMQK